MVCIYVMAHKLPKLKLSLCGYDSDKRGSGRAPSNSEHTGWLRCMLIRRHGGSYVTFPLLCSCTNNIVAFDAEPSTARAGCILFALVWVVLRFKTPDLGRVLVSCAPTCMGRQVSTYFQAPTRNTSTSGNRGGPGSTALHQEEREGDQRESQEYGSFSQRRSTYACFAFGGRGVCLGDSGGPALDAAAEPALAYRTGSDPSMPT
jgi:hypothetical protein